MNLTPNTRQRRLARIIFARLRCKYPNDCVTMSLMKTISLRELHESTGTWVREAARIGALVIPIAASQWPA